MRGPGGISPASSIYYRRVVALGNAGEIPARVLYTSVEVLITQRRVDDDIREAVCRVETRVLVQTLKTSTKTT